MPNETNAYIILTGALSEALNTNRKQKGLATIEDSLISRKLGILFALKTKKTVNFKAERVELDTNQLATLQELLDQYFNVDLTDDIQVIAIKPDHLLVNHTASSQGERKGWINKIKGFFKRKS